jgi:hypothetical protein
VHDGVFLGNLKGGYFRTPDNLRKLETGHEIFGLAGPLFYMGHNVAFYKGRVKGDTSVYIRDTAISDVNHHSRIGAVFAAGADAQNC